MMHHLHRPVSDPHHFLSRLDARVKIVTAGALVAMVISGTGLFFPLLVFLLATILTLSVGITLRLLLRRLAQPLFIAFMVLLLKLFLSGHEPLFRLDLGWLEIIGHRDGLGEGLGIGCRIAGAMTVVALLGFATPFSELLTGLAWLRVPRGLVEVTLFAWRYLFVLFDDATVVYNAQKNRLGYAGYRRGLNSFGTLAGLLVIKAFDHSERMTTAMVQRGYDGTMPLLPHRPFRLREVSGSLLLIAALGIVRAL